ncbi:MAG: AbrB/MazE/SpoVT family DNA-binding domain-containing protein [Calditrichaceae bacterium]|jgi:antitoxin component of MazEF toxin-antitoxin module
MIKQLQKIGNSRGIIIDRAILDLLQIDEDASFEITKEKDGLFLKPLTAKEAYKKIAKKHRKSLNKLAK